MISNKKGLGQVVSTLLMILITIAAVASIYGVINSFVNKQLDDTKSCYNVYDKIEINNQYTCYNETANETYISIEIKDIQIDSLLVSISYEDFANPFELSYKNEILPNVFNYPDKTPTVKLPGTEAGKTYIYNITGIPEKITIAPKINGKLCAAADTVDNVPTCI